MNLLLDTRVFLWWLDDPLKIAQEAALAVRNQDNLVYVERGNDLGNRN